jgi:hypothetical protein
MGGQRWREGDGRGVMRGGGRSNVRATYVYVCVYLSTGEGEGAPALPCARTCAAVAAAAAGRVHGHTHRVKSRQVISAPPVQSSMIIWIDSSSSKIS